MNLDKYRDFVRARGFADYRNFVIADFRKEYSEKNIILVIVLVKYLNICVEQRCL